MAKVKSRYETVFIVDCTNIGEDETNALATKFKSLIEENASVTNIDEWGKRRLAYPIDDLNEGYYVLVEFESAPSFPAELDRNFKITEGIMRSIIVCKDDVK